MGSHPRLVTGWSWARGLSASETPWDRKPHLELEKRRGVRCGWIDQLPRTSPSVALTVGGSGPFLFVASPLTADGCLACYKGATIPWGILILNTNHMAARRRCSCRGGRPSPSALSACPLLTGCCISCSLDAPLQRKRAAAALDCLPLY